MSEHQLWNELGNIYLNSGAFSQAIKAYDKAIEIAPEFGWAYSNMALAYMRLGEPEKSIPYYQRSIELLDDFSDKAVSWHRLGNSYQVMDDTKNAILAFQRSVELDPDNAAYRDDLAVAMAEYAYEADEEEEQAEAETAAVVEDVALPDEDEADTPDEADTMEASPDVEEEAEDVPTKNEFTSWLEQTIEKLSAKAFEKKSAAFEDAPIVFPKDVEPEDIIAKLMAVVERQTTEAEAAVDEKDDAEPAAEVVESDVAAQAEPVAEVETEPEAESEVVALAEADDEVAERELTVEEVVAAAKEEDEEELEQPEAADEAIPPVPAAIAKDLIPVLDTVEDDELDANVDNLMNELSKEMAFDEDEQVDDDVEQDALPALEDDAFEDNELEKEFEEDKEELEPAALDEEDIEDKEEDFEDNIDEDDDDRIISELKKEEVAAALASAEKFISGNGHKSKGNGNGNGKDLSMSTAKVWVELGNVFFTEGIFEGALIAYEKAIELDPEFGLALNNLALLHVRNGEYLRAVELYRKSLELLENGTDQAISWNNLGNTYRVLKEYEQAEQAYRKADELDTEKVTVENWTRYGLLKTLRS
ncbi:MAG: tetratricopeptide repeat protein [Chloroflexi bacterium]|nr:tetratricopeptide repeat protein [Chloroflexota bacterium]